MLSDDRAPPQSSGGSLMGWYLSPVGLALADQALVSGANFLHVLAAARCLGMEDFGVFSLAWAGLTFAGNIHQALVLQPLSVLYAEFAPGPARRYLHLLECFHLGQLLLLFPAMLAAWLLPAWGGLILVTAIASLLRQAAEHERRVAYALYSSPRALFIDVATYAPLACAAAWCWLHPRPLTREQVMFAAALPAALGWLVGRWLHGQARSGGSGAAHPVAPVGQHWRFGKWVLVSTMGMYAGSQLYPFLIAGILGAREVAALAASRSLIGVSHVIMNGVEAYAAPRMRRCMLHEGFPEMEKMAIKASVLMAAFIAPMLLGAWLAPGWLMRHVIDERYSEYWWVLSVFGLLYVLNAASRVIGMVLSSANEPRAGAMGYAMTALLTVVLGPTVVYKWGLTGCVWALVANAGVLIAVQCVYYRKTARANGVQCA